MSLITIASQDIADWHGAEAPAFARLIANQEFVTSENVIVAPGDGFYQQFTCSVVGNKIQIASGSAYSTTDSDTPWATYTLAIYSAKGHLLTTIAGNLRIPDTPSSTTWTSLIEYSQALVQPHRFAYYDTNQMNTILAGYYTRSAADAKFQTLVQKIITAQGGILPIIVSSTNCGALFLLDGTNGPAVNIVETVFGVIYTFYIATNHLVQIGALGHTIRIGSLSGTQVSASTQGNALTIVAISDTEWVALSTVGTWTVT